MQDYLGHLLCLFHGERRVSVYVYPVKPFIWYVCTCLVTDTASNSWIVNLKGFSDAASRLDFFHYFNILSKISSWCLPPVSHSETLPCSPVRNQIAGYPCDHLVTASAQHSLQKITVTIFFFLQKVVFFLCTLKSITECQIIETIRSVLKKDVFVDSLL